MSAIALHRLFLTRTSLPRWFAVVATLASLLMPVSFGVAAANAGIDGLFASELCSVTRATGSNSGDRQTPTHDSHQHCPICRTVQQLGTCDLPPSMVVLAIVRPNVDRDFPSVDVVRSFQFQSPAQPRAPPVRA
jgi:Protein of unknown function (DUF2946)